METETTLDSVDFRDVFGGPPRRSSIHEMMRYSFSEGADSAFSGRRLGASPSFRDPWNGAEEKPVFGGGAEEGNRRRGLREDFFVDIFGGTESPSSPTPRKHDRDVFPASSPGSRAISPAWQLPPRAAEGFAGLSSGPTQFSLPDKLSKSADSPAFGSPTRTSNKEAASNLHSPKVSAFGFSSRTVQVHDEPGSSGPHYRPSPLFQRFSVETDGSLSSMKHEKLDDLETYTGNPGDVTSSPQFHFSIYKWASKGVPLIMPLKRSSSLRSKEKGKIESGSFSERTETSSEISEFPSATMVNIGNRPDSSEAENQSLSNLSSNAEVEASKPVEDKTPPPQKQEALDSKRNSIVEDNSRRSAPNNKDENSSGPALTNSRKSSEKEMKGGSRPELKPLHAFFQDRDEEQSNIADVVEKKTERTSRISKGSSRKGNDIKNSKKRDQELFPEKSEEAEKVVTKGSPRNSGENTGKRLTKGKVNEFIKIFNQEAPPAKPKTSVHPRGQTFSEKENGTSEATGEAYTHRNVAVNDRVSVSQSENPPVHSSKVADIQRESKKEHSTTDKTDILFRDTSPGPKNNSASSTVSVTDDANLTDEDAEESSRTNFTIKVLPQDENKQGQPSEDREEIQAIDDKIRQWSRGKEGNIRSLLSTLQYVLWPGSGWKPVPLVNIIEGPAVKRAYQRALLSLHPDKLQQKGAAPNQKYIAEQVFDILQEAWTQFNTLGLGAL